PGRVEVRAAGRNPAPAATGPTGRPAGTPGRPRVAGIRLRTRRRPVRLRGPRAPSRPATVQASETTGVPYRHTGMTPEKYCMIYQGKKLAKGAPLAGLPVPRRRAATPPTIRGRDCARRPSIRPGKPPAVRRPTRPGARANSDR